MLRWIEECQVAFDNLKWAMLEDPMFILLDVTKPFEVQSDALDFSLGGVLL